MLRIDRQLACTEDAIPCGAAEVVAEPATLALAQIAAGDPQRALIDETRRRARGLGTGVPRVGSRGARPVDTGRPSVESRGASSIGTGVRPLDAHDAAARGGDRDDRCPRENACGSASSPR